MKALYIEITSKCNKKCLHCYNSSGGSCRELEMFAFRKALSEGVELGVDAISISGGEPLLSDNFFDVLEEVAKYQHLSCNIITNGTLISEGLLRKVRSLGLKKVSFQLSLDGQEKEHDFLRGEGTYREVMKAVDLLKEFCFDFYFHSVIYRNNYTKLEELIELAAQCGATMIDFSFLKSKGRKIEYDSIISLGAEEQLNVTNTLSKLKERYASKDLKINRPTVFYGICPIFASERATTLFLRIDVNGDVYYCQNFDGKCNSAGNIKEEALATMVSENRIGEVRSSLINRNINMQCEKCFLKSFCGRGCPGTQCDYRSSIYSDECLLRRLYAKKILNEFAENDKETKGK